MGEGFAGTIIKDTWTITRGGWKQGKEVGRAGVVGNGGEKGQKTVLEQQLKKIWTCGPKFSMEFGYNLDDSNYND